MLRLSPTRARVPSAGVAILGPHAEAGKALEEADSAMYVRKAQRRHEG